MVAWYLPGSFAAYDTANRREQISWIKSYSRLSIVEFCNAADLYMRIPQLVYSGYFEMETQHAFLLGMS